MGAGQPMGLREGLSRRAVRKVMRAGLFCCVCECARSVRRRTRRLEIDYASFSVTIFVLRRDCASSSTSCTGKAPPARIKSHD